MEAEKEVSRLEEELKMLKIDRGAGEGAGCSWMS